MLFRSASIYYRVGWHDQITVKDFDFFFARGYLKTISPYLKSHGDRLQLPKAMIRTMKAQAYGWVGGALFEKGKRKVARRFLAQSLRYRLWQPRAVIMFIRTIVPVRVDTLALNSYRAIKRAIGSGPLEV